ncbi:hypothetical protein O181_081290 [Austropuccinia psidii MF-1]|uniref:CCHC-type domain-containing protein n=1 Tax=Austropuccinia psidii MF-1 TaxID=1389203 RepID=A0A9Q3FIR0_9BASI|nr:hypothetical protein [Austropuccinia psidii MF-1]
MSDYMIEMKIYSKFGGELEHSIKCRCVGTCSTEEYINALEDIITRTKIGKTWTRKPMESKVVPKTSREDRRPDRPVLKCYKCGRTSHLAKTFTKKTNINEAQVVEAVQYAEETEESDQYSAISEGTTEEYYPIEKITNFFEVIEVHNSLTQYSEN